MSAQKKGLVRGKPCQAEGTVLVKASRWEGLASRAPDPTPGPCLPKPGGRCLLATLTGVLIPNFESFLSDSVRAQQVVGSPPPPAVGSCLQKFGQIASVLEAVRGSVRTLRVWRSG